MRAVRTAGLRLLIILGLISSGACSTGHSRGKQSLEKEPPLSIVLDQAFVSGEKLHVKGIVETKTKLDPKTIAVTLKGLEDGELRYEQTHRLSEVAAGLELPRGSRTAVWFSIPAVDVNEYELVCRWGGDGPAVASGPETKKEQLAFAATGAAAEKREPKKELRVGGSILSLGDVGVERSLLPCDADACDETIAVNASLMNGTEREISSVQMLLGLAWVADGESVPRLPESAPPQENEELVELRALNLKPGEARQVRVKVADPVPVVPGGKFVPHLRLVPPGA